MKNLFIIRHAKSSWENPLLSDKKRPLNSRGLEDAPLMANRLMDKKIFPDSLLSSDAERAKQTAFIFAHTFKFPKNQIILTPHLYHASAYQIMASSRNIGDHFETVFLFAHNPGINELAQMLRFPVENIPTTGILGIQFRTEKWENIAVENAEICYYDFPKNNKF
jgi:phosphohistidine phosphatase